MRRSANAKLRDIEYDLAFVLLRQRAATVKVLPQGATVDVAIVGAGPAGLTAALYLARFLRTVAIIDAGDSRAAWIPISHNHPGSPHGISGKDLLASLREQVAPYPMDLYEGTAQSLVRQEGGFRLATTCGDLTSRFVILATGLEDHTPAIASFGDLIAAGTVRLCPVCDAFEARHKRIGVIGNGEGALKEARFLKRYSDTVTILGSHPAGFTGTFRERAAQLEVEILDTVKDMRAQSEGVEVRLGAGTCQSFDLLYCALGCTVRTALSAGLGAEQESDGPLLVDAHQRTSISDLYAIGDVASGLNQISVAYGGAAIAASDINRRMLDDMPG